MENNNNTKKLPPAIKIVLMVILIIIITIAAKSNKNSLNKSQETSSVSTNEGEPEILGRKDDLLAFSIDPNTKLSGNVSYTGTIKGAYFFEGNILVSITDSNKEVIRGGHAQALTDWMTTGPVDFGGVVDLNDLPKGHAYIKIQNDNPSDEVVNVKEVFIPIVID